MRTLVLLVFVTISAAAQTPVLGYLPCFFPNPVTTVAPYYFQVSATSPAVQCEQITLDTSVSTARNAQGNIVVSALSGQPAHKYTTVLEWPFTNSNAFYLDPPNTTPATPFNGQPIWCSSTSNAAIQTYVSQLGSFLPTMLIEVRAAGLATPLITTPNVLSAQNPNGGQRYLWMQSSSACGGNPGIAWTQAASIIMIGTSPVGPSNLLQVMVVGLL